MVLSMFSPLIPSEFHFNKHVNIHCENAEMRQFSIMLIADYN